MKVKVVQNSGDMVLVQWAAGEEKVPTRAWVHAVDVIDGEVVHPEKGIPHGIDFSQVLQIQPVGPKDVSRELRKLGIWTIEDLRQNPGAVFPALSEAFGVNIAAIFRAANDYEQVLKSKPAVPVEELPTP